MDYGLQILDSIFLSMELGFRISIVRGIPDSLSCIPHFASKNFPDSPTGVNLRKWALETRSNQILPMSNSRGLVLKDGS